MSERKNVEMSHFRIPEWGDELSLAIPLNVLPNWPLINFLKVPLNTGDAIISQKKV